MHGAAKGDGVNKILEFGLRILELGNLGIKKFRD